MMNALQKKIRLSLIVAIMCAASFAIAYDKCNLSELYGEVAPNSPLSTKLQSLDTVDYDALYSSMNLDSPSIAVRDDGLVRIAIHDFQGTCCPLVAPLKVATLSAEGWEYLTINNYGDHPTPKFLPNGDLGILFMDYADLFTVKFAKVGNTNVQVEDAIQLDGNPSQFFLTPWVVDSNNDVQAVVLYDLRLKRTETGWSWATLGGTPQDIENGPNGEIVVLTSQGLWTFSSLEIDDPGFFIPIDGEVSNGNLTIDRKGQTHVAYTSNGGIVYGRLWRSGKWTFETVATEIHNMLNAKALVIDKKGTPFVIYENSERHIIVVAKQSSGWKEVVDLGPGIYGNMVLGPLGNIHITFTSTSDKLVRYACLSLSAKADKHSKR